MVRGGLLISRFRMMSNLSWSVESSGIKGLLAFVVFVLHLLPLLSSPDMSDKESGIGFLELGGAHLSR
jgi:hypothetical protein